MELLIFRHSEYEKLYENNCSYDINLIPIEQRINHADGIMMIGLSALFVIIYIPTLIVMWRYTSKTAYKLMFIIGFADATTLTMMIPFGLTSLTGVVFCSYPKTFYINGCLAEGLWIFSTEMSSALTLYRCLELAKLVNSNPSTARVADWFFKEKRYLIWISISLLHSILCTLFGTPLVYSPIFGTYAPNPHAGYIEDIDQRFSNLHSKVYTMALLSVGIGLFIAFVYLMLSLRKGHSNGPSSQVLAAEKKALVQAVIITSCFAITIIYWEVVFSGVFSGTTVPRIATFIGMTLSVCGSAGQNGDDEQPTWKDHTYCSCGINRINNFWPDFLEQQGIKPLVVLSKACRENITNIVDRLCEVTLSQNLEVLVEVKTAISNAGGHIGQKIQTKLDFVMQNNPGLSKMAEIAKVQNGEEAELEVETMAPKQ
ncbi:serpentine type 7TM GPCR chemoreceptor srt domain-containing protein [Ditylenchus destructor]|uniref:Serpentine type 7TM GPCR chemoreceptor srt domain-containing protein n=1 Tax=Ditylenchus destructor TaxID=166010 RepID=A0AAD4MG87_9BILA|nr:serpentine type 7TM GPCR chemoreceptor srt domain-containing protein [Ditylenchus destructor]